MSDLPYVCFSRRTLLSLIMPGRALVGGGECKVLSNHLQEDRVDVQDQTLWHMQEQQGQCLQHGFMNRNNHLLKLSEIIKTVKYGDT